MPADSEVVLMVVLIGLVALAVLQAPRVLYWVLGVSDRRRRAHWRAQPTGIASASGARTDPPLSVPEDDDRPYCPYCCVLVDRAEAFYCSRCGTHLV